jgi:hypothetical protein
MLQQPPCAPSPHFVVSLSNDADVVCPFAE